QNGLPRPSDYPYGQDAVDQFMQDALNTAPLEEIRENARMMEELLLADKIVTKEKESRDSRTCCKFIWSKFQLGGWPEHDDYASKVFGVRSELIVVARDGD